MRAKVITLGVLLLVCSLSAQSVRYANVAGVVKDEHGGVIPGVAVSLDGPDRLRETVTDERGAFSFGLVPAGSSRLRASLPGFVPYEREVNLRPDRPEHLSIVMKIGSMSESVTVSSQSQTINISRSSPAGSLADFEFNREGYAHIEGNTFQKVSDHPRSTFSIDVDTASYTNVRRLLGEGSMPPPDAVRVEELINYFKYDYPLPSGNSPIAVTTEVGRCPWNEQHYLALVGLQGRRIETTIVPPGNLVFLIDVSGSMDEPNKLPLVKSAMTLLVDTLREQDRVAIVVYAGASGLALRSTSGDQKAVIREAIARLQPGGSTNGAEGIVLAYQIAAQHFIKGGVNRVILATDGDFNVGVTSDGELVRLIEKKRETGVFLSVLGVGSGNLQDSKMEQLADKGNGNYAYLDTLHEAQRALVEQASGTLVTIAKDVKLQIEFNPRTVAGYRLVGYENRLLKDEDFNDDRKDAGEIGAGHSVTALYELVPAGQAVEASGVDSLKYQSPARAGPASRAAELMTIKVRYKDPDGENSRPLTVGVPDTVVAFSTNLGFAAAVAQFGMLLRNSEHRGTSTYESALDLGRKFRGADPAGYRGEFLRLVDLASRLDRTQARARETR